MNTVESEIVAMWPVLDGIIPESPKSERVIWLADFTHEEVGYVAEVLRRAKLYPCASGEGRTQIGEFLTMNQTNTLPQKNGPVERNASSGWFASFFKRKPKQAPAELTKELECKEPLWWPKWEAVMEAYPPGRRFEYLGRQMVVKWQRHYWPMSDWPFALPIYPAIIAEYADERGVIHEHRFENAPWNLLPAR